MPYLNPPTLAKNPKSQGEVRKLTDEEFVHVARMDAAIQEAAQWLLPPQLKPVLYRLMGSDLSVKAKRHRLIHIADEANKTLAPFTPCAKGCNACCKQHVSILQHEADAIGAHIGRKPSKVPKRDLRTIKSEEHVFAISEGLATKYRSVPCTFLRPSGCSIYEVRPMECRLHHTLNPTPTQCDTIAVRPEDSCVTTFNVQDIEMAHSILGVQQNEPWGDIREFFP